MRSIRGVASAAATLTLILVLAACGQGTAASPSQGPSMPAPSGDGSPQPAPSDMPASPAPSESPEASPSPVDVVELDLPIIARVTEDGVEVRTEPRADAPVATAEDLTGSGSEPDVILGSDDRVLVTLGPVFADGESFYEVAAADGSELQFAFGWIPGRLLEADAEVPGFAPMATIHGQGDGDEASADVLPGTPVTVRFAATTMPDSDECDIDVTFVASDGEEIRLASEQVTDVAISEFTADQLAGLFQQEPGTVTLQVETDCSFAATMITP